MAVHPLLKHDYQEYLSVYLLFSRLCFHIGFERSLNFNSQDLHFAILRIEGKKLVLQSMIFSFNGRCQNFCFFVGSESLYFRVDLFCCLSDQWSSINHVFLKDFLKNRMIQSF